MYPASHTSNNIKPELVAREELIDTYELFAGIFKESGGFYSLIPKLDTTLPFIYGKPALVRDIFCHFLSQYLADSSKAGGKNALISHSKDRLNWIFDLHFLSPTGEPLPAQRLRIHKASIQHFFCNSFYPLQSS